MNVNEAFIIKQTCTLVKVMNVLKKLGNSSSCKMEFLMHNNKTKNNPYTHDKAQALLLQRQSPDKGMPHKNPAKESDTCR